MLRVTDILDHAPETNELVVLDYEARRKRRHVIETSSGESVLIDLPLAPHLKDGNGLKLEDGRFIKVCAKKEALIEITTADPLRIAWHLGNRHLPTQIKSSTMLIREDHVIENMLIELGCILNKIEGPFDPEGGAYGGHHHHD